MSGAGKVVVTQADRIAASWLEPNGRERDQILRGKHDKTERVQAFARHRIAAEAAQLDALREAADALQLLLNMPGDVDGTCNPPELGAAALAERRAAWIAARQALTSLSAAITRISADGE